MNSMCRHFPATETSRSGFTLLEILAVVSVVLVLAALLLGVQRVGMAKAQSAKCLANLRHIGLGLQQYVAEHQGNLPAMSALANPESGGGAVLTAQQLLAPYTGWSSDFAWNNNANVAASYGVWICPADTEDRNRANPDLARWKGMNSYLVNYYVGKSVVDANGQNTNSRTIEKMIETDRASSLWYFADGISSTGGQGRMSVGMVDAAENQVGALQLRFRHGETIHVLHLAGNVSAFPVDAMPNNGETFLNPRP